MADLTLTHTLANGTTADASQVQTDLTDITTYINNRNTGSATWDMLKVTHATNIPATFNNSSGTQDILRCQDNGSSVLAVADGGASTISATAGGSSVALTVNNSTSTGSILIAQDNGTAVFTVADGGTTTARALDGGSGKALIANNGTSTGNILEAQDNGSAVLTVADGGVVTMANQSAARAYNSVTQTISTGAFTKCVWDTESYDVKSEMDIATNERFTATVAGKYLVSAAVTLANTTADVSYILSIYKNGAGHSSYIHDGARTDTDDQTVHITDILSLAAADYVEIFLFHDKGSDETLLEETSGGVPGLNYFSVHKLA